MCLHDGGVEGGEIQGGDRDIVVAVRARVCVCVNVIVNTPSCVRFAYYLVVHSSSIPHTYTHVNNRMGSYRTQNQTELLPD